MLVTFSIDGMLPTVCYPSSNREEGCNLAGDTLDIERRVARALCFSVADGAHPSFGGS